MDVVLNHVHQYHPYVTQHPDWFDPRCTCGTAACPWSSHIETCWFTGYLPDVAFDRPESLEAQVDDAMGWVRRFDLDGLRVDAVPMMPRFVTRLLTARAHRLEGLRTRQYLLGETYTGPEGHDLIRWYLGPQGLDGQFDFPLMWALRAVFAHESAPLWTLDDVFAASREAWAGSTAVMGLMVGNHDVTRFLSEAAGQYTGDPWNEPPPVPDDPVPYRRLLLAQAFVLTAPGAPILYYGDELGMPGAGDPDNRRPMRFDAERSANERALQAQIERLGRLRRCLPALRRGGFEPLRVTRDQYAYLRDVGDGAPALVVLNRAAQPADVRVALPRGLGPLVDALSGAPAVPAADGELRVRVGARSPAVLIPAANPCLEGAPR
jgi:glycosidase